MEGILCDSEPMGRVTVFVVSRKVLQREFEGGAFLKVMNIAFKHSCSAQGRSWDFIE